MVQTNQVKCSGAGNAGVNAKRVFVDTNQYCEEASLDSQKLINFLRKSGFVHTTDVKQADVLIFYACGHLRRHETDSIRIIKEINRTRKSSSELIVWGCLPKINPRSLETIYDGPIVGPEEWGFFSNYFGQPREAIDSVYANTLNVHSKLLGTSASPTRRITNSLREGFYGQIGRMWYIKVVSGCRNCCTYCSDRLAYRWIKSVPVKRVLEQFEVGLKAGYEYFNLVGRDLGSYGYDVKLSLTDLLNEMIEKYPDQDYKVYLTNVSPNSLIDMYDNMNHTFLSKKVFELGSHIQSGSDRILRLMGKTFSTREWIRVMKDIDKNYPEIRTRTSIMVGFPGETEEDFQETINLLSNMLFDRIDVYAYEERPNIPSLRLKGRISEAAKQKRYDRMRFLAALNNIEKRMKRAQFFY